MAIYALRANLSSPLFPFASEFGGRSIVIPQFDQNFDRTTLNAPGVTIDKGIPQAYYMHNCLPTPQGYQSIGYKPGLMPDACTTVPFETDFDTVFPIQNVNGNKFLFVPAAGKNYIYDAQVGTWKSVSPVAPGTYPENIQVTTAFIQGQSYIFYEKVGAFIYDDVLKVLTSVVLTALDVTKVKGIAAASGYMIAWTDNNVAWSSLTTPTDFTPSLITGAGGGAINDAKGNILACLFLSGGFIIYCQQNAVGARFSGNINFPFIFKEIPGSGGIEHIQDVSWHSNLAYHVAWTGNGLQRLTLTTSDAVYPEAADFLAGQIFEDFDELTNTFSTQYLTHPVNLSLNIIDARFLVISYGVTRPDFTHALVFDLVLNRWGKLKLQHRNCFQFTFPNIFGSTTYGQLKVTTYGQLGQTTYADFLLKGSTTQDLFKNSFAFLQQDGDVQLVDFSFGEANARGVLLTGKYQFQRAQRVEHQMCEVDVVASDNNNFTYYIVPSQDGKTLQDPIPGFLVKKGDKTRVYKKLINAYSISALFVGAFNLVSLNFTFTQGGYAG